MRGAWKYLPRVLAGMLGVLATSAHAERLRVLLPLDPSVPAARALYAKLHIEERFGITFHPYASVCPAVAPGSARCFAKVITDEAGVPLSHRGLDIRGYGPKQLRAAYSVPGAASGQPIIGIVDAYGYPGVYSDLKGYSRHFKLPILPKCDGDVASSPGPCIQVVNQKGGRRLPKTVDPGWEAEQAIDVQLAHAMCENCSILLVEGNTNGLGDMLPALKTAALRSNVVSNSWGTDDSVADSGLDHTWLTYPGVVITASTGDDGYARGLFYPSSSPNAVGVGGTSLFLTSNGKKYATEIAWTGAGSGCSAFEARPSWQPSLPGCPDNRTVSDISVDADPNTGVAIYAGDGCTDGDCWYVFGGTSISSPIVAGMFAVAGNIQPDNTQAASILYANASKRNSRDIVSGSTGTCEFAYLCNAVPGYDGPTGLGSPKGLSIFLDNGPRLEGEL